MSTPLPLEGLRVVDMATDKAELCGRVLADLGADVVRLEPPDGAPSRRMPPFHGSRSLYFEVRNFNKRSVIIDLASSDGRSRLLELLAGADVWIETTKPGTLGSVGLDPAQVASQLPHLVVTSASDFGQTGPYRDYEATDAVLQGLGGEIFRSGLLAKPPLLVPGSFSYDVGGVLAAFATLTAYWQKINTGRGQHIDFSIYEAVAQCTDWSLPNYSAAANQGAPYGELRMGSGIVYPLFPCADGWVRLVILSPRQWHAMRAWLGEPEFLQDPHWDSLLGRMEIQDDILDPMYKELFSKYGMEELAAEAQERGIVMTPVLHPAAVLKSPHFVARETFSPVPVGSESGQVASSFIEVDGGRAGLRSPAPALGSGSWPAWEPRPADAAGQAPPLPFAGLRVIDFGHGGVGVECGRLFAEYGADVIKIESRSYPDFIRMVAGSEMSASFASSSRSKRSFGVNIKTDDGLALVRELIAGADVVIENNSTGTMDGLGLGYPALRAINPRVIMVSSQLMGSTGPWATWLGYGPSTRAAGGMTWLWNFPDGDPPPGSFVIFPDHLAGRVCTVAAIAGLIERAASGHGRHFEVAQVETVLSVMSQFYLQESLSPGSVKPAGNRSDIGAPWGVYRCAGEERWCVITCRDDDDWAGICKAMDLGVSDDWSTVEGRRRHHDEIDELITAWTSVRHDREVMEILQSHGVPAGMMMYASDQPSDPHLRARGYLAEVDQPGVGRMTLEGPSFQASAMGRVDIRPAPALGEHTREIAGSLLGLAPARIEELIALGVLETS